MRYGFEYKNGYFNFVQNKTGEIISVPATDALRSRLGTQTTGYLLGVVYKEDWFRHLFSRVRRNAGLPKEAKFMHLRHTAIVRLARAQCTTAEIAAVTGHTLQSVHAILKRYLPRDEQVAKNAISKLNNSVKL